MFKVRFIVLYTTFSIRNVGQVISHSFQFSTKPNLIFGDFVNKHRPFGKPKPPYVFYTLLAVVLFIQLKDCLNSIGEKLVLFLNSLLNEAGYSKPNS